MIAAAAALLLAGAVPNVDDFMGATFPHDGGLPYERAEAEELLAHIEPACADVPGPCEAEMVAKARQSIRLLRDLDFRTSRRVADEVRVRCRAIAMGHGAFDADSYMGCAIETAHWSRARQLALAGLQSRGVTMAGFYSIHSGMGLDDVALILGRPGEIVSSAIGHEVAFDVYQWPAPRGGLIVVSFQDGGVAAKSQSGLK